MLKITMTLPTLVHQNGALWKRVLPRFQREAGELIVEAIRKQLGQDSTYQLTEVYSERKVAGKTKPRMKRYAGMSADEPLVLSGAMYDGVSAEIEGNTLVVSVRDGAGVSKSGFDYAQEWESEVGFLEAGFREVEDQLPELLESIIVEEMMLAI